MGIAIPLGGNPSKSSGIIGATRVRRRGARETVFFLRLVVVPRLIRADMALERAVFLEDFLADFFEDFLDALLAMTVSLGD